MGVFGLGNGTTGIGVQGDGSGNSPGVVGNSTYNHGVIGNGYGDTSAGLFGNGNGANGTGVFGYGNGNGSGVFGAGGLYGVKGSVSNSGYGVHGTAGIGYGVYGTAPTGVGVGGDSGNVGVAGRGGGDTSGNTTGFPVGVRGSVTNSGYGVYGGAGIGYGVYGGVTNGVGVGGVATAGGTGVSGSSTSGPGVHGTSSTGVGVYGTSGGGANPFGVVGSVTSAPGFALYGIVSVAGAVGFAAGASVAGAIAGQFSGPVNIYNTSPTVPGNLYIQGNYTASGTKSAAVAHPDGSHRLLYCVESPEAWFEDFGTGTLVGGKATVNLDPDFAAVVDTGTLHVFPVSHNASHHLAVTAAAGTTFAVEAGVASEAAAKGVKAGDLNGTFTYRVVARRKDVKAERLARFELPKEIKLTLPPIAPLPETTTKKG